MERRARRGLAAVGLAAVVVAAIGAAYLRPWVRLAPAPAPAPRATPARSVSVQQVLFLSASLGWVVTGDVTASSLFRTTDGGRHWQRQLDGVAGQGWALRFFDARRGVVFGANQTGVAVWRTGDGGQRWTRAKLPSATAPALVSFADPDHGWCLVSLEAPGFLAAGPVVDRMDFSLFRTVDGGVTWREVLATNRSQPVVSGLGDDGVKTWIWFRDADVGWIGQINPGALGVVYATSDGGSDWTRQELPPPAAGWGSASLGIWDFGPPVIVAGRPALLAVSPFVPGAQSATFVTTSDYVYAGGAPSWTGPVQLPAGAIGFVAVSPTDEARWWVTTGPGLLETDDAGAHWHTIGLAPGAWLFWRLFIAEAGHAWAQLIDPRTCYTGLPCIMALARSTDGGQHWTVLRAPV